MENLKMNHNTIIITGSDGYTAKGLINYFSYKYNYQNKLNKLKELVNLKRFLKIDKIKLNIPLKKYFDN